MLNRVANFQHSLNTSARSIKSLVGVLQLNSNKNLEANFETTQSFVEACVQRGAKLVKILFREKRMRERSSHL
jgi:hypothetical protein